jgi:transcriptional regulator with XRE-family HTH domain
MTNEELLEMRQEMGWTQYFLADALGVTRSSLAHWEGGRAPIPWNVESAVKNAHARVLKALEKMSLCF